MRSDLLYWNFQKLNLNVQNDLVKWFANQAHQLNVRIAGYIQLYTQLLLTVTLIVRRKILYRTSI